jgi:lysylphosphatidylglycerol synthetase-like protein (DUF2156 family)
MKQLFLNNNNAMKGHLFLASSWLLSLVSLGLVSLISLNKSIAVILSSIASIFAIVNYVQQIRKRNKNS